jgi:hypothetical protein
LLIGKICLVIFGFVPGKAIVFYRTNDFCDFCDFCNLLAAIGKSILFVGESNISYVCGDMDSPTHYCLLWMMIFSAAEYSPLL